MDSPSSAQSTPMRATERLQVRILGVVQGVGFRPFVYRLAKSLNLAGWVRNDGDGVTIEVEGPNSNLLSFLQQVQQDKPAPAYIYALDHRFLPAAGYDKFEIQESQSKGPPLVWILPDLAICRKCAAELLDRANRRYRYPFTNCTHCGPRFTIIENLPYDRPFTSMKSFPMCDLCREEYHNPEDRRFHAQPNACRKCGPHVEFGSGKEVVAKGEEAILLAESLIRKGGILMVKGIGGFHVMADARNEQAVAELRKRKRRPYKAFALMYPDYPMLSSHVQVPSFAEPFLSSTQAPILLLARTKRGWEEIAPSVAPRSPYLGVFLPYTPLHILLLRDLGFPVVATSGNLSEEPIQYQDAEALERLSSLCDGFLIHNRPIVRQADDSVLQVITKPRVRPQLLRRARGYSPLPLLAPRELPPLLALGGHLNLTFALSRGKEIILSQHLGDLENYESRKLYRETLQDFLKMYELKPQAVAHDLHPDYYTTELADEFGLPKFAVQHHHAHMAACMLENQLEGTVLGLTWDGTGYGTDKTIWGGEFLLGDAQQYRRVGSLYPFCLPGGEIAIKQSWRIGLSLLYESFGPDLPRELPLFTEIPGKMMDGTLQLISKRVRSPATTSMGRLFDGVSAILGLSFYNLHQAQSAQLLEYAAWEHGIEAVALPFPIQEGDLLRMDWRPLIRTLVERYRRGISRAELAAAFHQAIVQASLDLIAKIGGSRVVLAGGVFCNRYLTETLLKALEGKGIAGYIHSQLPPTDGSLSVGQLWVAAQNF